MPEKPEVMTVCKALRTKILNKKITGCNVYWNNIIAKPEVNLFKKNIIGQRINNIFSRGKFTFRNVGEEFEKHEHVELILDNKISWRYRDVRKFGKMYLISKDKVNLVKPLKDLGYDFYDSNLNEDYLYEKIHKKNLAIKTVLLDQSIIAGIGNIYDDEILFLSKISPLRKANEITKKECSEIIKNTKYVLSEAVKLGGTTIRSFTSSEGVHGLFQNKLLVHGKENEKCPNCGNVIRKIKVGGRGTYYCNKCQK